MQSGSSKSKTCTTCMVFMIGVLLIMDQGKVEAQFSEAASAFMTCYSSCFFLCFITPGHTSSYCSLECLKDCIIPKFTTLVPEDESMRRTSASTASQDKNMATPDQFCKFGCASVLCSNISTNKNPQAVKVSKCVGKCSNMCTSNNHSSP